MRASALATATLAGSVVLGGPGGLAGCAAFDSDSSPDLVYSTDAAAARRLQVPPDLTAISDAEQFVLPGDAGGPVTRNTLLPEFDSVRFVRDAGEAHLAFEQAPEDLWPRLLEFLAEDGWEVDRTEPVAGVVATRWREPGGAERPGALGRLIGAGGDARARVAFRLERGADGARLFARRQLADADAVEAGTAPDWPAASSDPETTSALLARLLVFLGVDEQRSRGLIDAADARELLEPATVRTGGAGSQLVVHRGYRSAWEALLGAIEAEGMTIESRDDSVGRVAFLESDAGAGDAGEDVGGATLVASLVPVHVSAVRVELADPDGRRLETGRERALLDALRDAIAAGETAIGTAVRGGAA